MIYYVNAKGDKVNPNEVPPLTPIFTVNTDEKGHEEFLKELRGEKKGDGVVRLSDGPDKATDPPSNNAPLPKSK